MHEHINKNSIWKLQIKIVYFLLSLLAVFCTCLDVYWTLFNLIKIQTNAKAQTFVREETNSLQAYVHRSMLVFKFMRQVSKKIHCCQQNTSDSTKNHAEHENSIHSIWSLPHFACGRKVGAWQKKEGKKNVWNPNGMPIFLSDKITFAQWNCAETFMCALPHSLKSKDSDRYECLHKFPTRLLKASAIHRLAIANGYGVFEQQFSYTQKTE